MVTRTANKQKHFKDTTEKQVNTETTNVSDRDLSIVFT